MRPFCKCRSGYVRRKLLEEREELTLARTLELTEQCESVEHLMSQLSMSEPSKVDANRVYEKAGRPKSKQRSKGNKGREFIAIVVGQLVIWAEIQNARLEAKPVENVKGKTILLVSAKPKQRNQELTKYMKNHKPVGSKLIMLSWLLIVSSQTCLSCLWLG